MQKIVKSLKQGLKGCIEIPSDKSISHRTVIISSLSKGNAIVNNFSKGADCRSTVAIYKNLGLNIEYLNDKTLKIKSNGTLIKPKKPLNCGNSGTTMRLTTGVLAGQNFTSILTGDDSLSKRPMKRIIEPLTLMGAQINSNDGKAPLKIIGQQLKGIEYKSALSSAQVKSCILLAGVNAIGNTIYTEPFLSRNHSELMLDYFEADIKYSDNKTILKPSKLKLKDITIPGDISSAAFFIAAALIIPNSEIILKNISLNPTRTGILDILQRMGANIEILDKYKYANEDVGDIKIKYSELNGTTISGSDIPRLIDELPVLAVLATQALGETIVKDAQDLRKKESDRISTIVKGLKSLGADIEEFTDGFKIKGKTNLKGNVTLEAFSDHRLAMSYYVAGLISKKDILINGFEWINISFPEFENLFYKLSS